MTSALQRDIRNSATGDAVTFVNSPLLGDGERLVFRGLLAARAAGAPLHSHDRMTETFRVESGVLEIDLGDGRIERLSAGQELTIAPGVRHAFRNPTDSETCFVTTADPGSGLEIFLRAQYELDNRRIFRGGVELRDILRFARALQYSDLVIDGCPRWLQRIGIAGLARLARIARVDAIPTGLTGAA